MPLRDGDWDGKSVVVIGGGPSLQDFDWDLLPVSMPQIAINMAFMRAPRADAFFTEDLRVIELCHGIISDFTKPTCDLNAVHEAWKAFSGTKVFHALDPSYVGQALGLDREIQVIERKRKDKYWSYRLEEGLSYSSNSAIGALNLAQIMGAKTIYCLGLDCRMMGREANYHSMYPQEWRMASGQDESFKSDFEHWAELHLRKAGVRVVNVINPAFPSAIEAWPKMPYKEFYTCER